MSSYTNHRANGNGRKSGLDVVLPSNPDAERVVLGSILFGAVDFATVERGLATGDFSLEKHRRIFSCMADLHARGEKIDRVTLANELMHRKQLDSVDGLTYLVSLDDGLIQDPNVDSYMKIVREKAVLRRLIFAGTELRDGALLEIDNPRELIESHLFQLEKIGAASPDTSDSVLAEIPSVWKYETSTSYLVNDLIAEGAVTIWTGESGDGKSTLALALAAAVAQGQSFLGRAVKQRQVFYIDRENPIAVVKDRIDRLGIPEIHGWLKIWGTWWQGHEPPGPAAPCLIAAARRRKPLIVFDSLIAFSRCDENSSFEMRRHMNLYRELAAAGATILIIHHRSDKGETDYRGSSDIRAVVDSGWRLSRDDGSGAGDALGKLVLKPYKTRIEPGKQIRIEYVDGAFLPIDAPPRPLIDIAIDLVATNPGATQKELQKLGPRQGLPYRRVAETSDAAVLAGRIHVLKGNHNTRRYYPPEGMLTSA